MPNSAVLPDDAFQFWRKVGENWDLFYIWFSVFCVKNSKQQQSIFFKKTREIMVHKKKPSNQSELDIRILTYSWEINRTSCQEETTIDDLFFAGEFLKHVFLRIYFLRMFNPQEITSLVRPVTSICSHSAGDYRLSE
jgi:hypothetical protein